MNTPPFPVELFEEHAQTLPCWWRRRQPRSVVYLDAHLDLQRTAPDTLAALADCVDEDAVRALASPHHLHPGRGRAYGIEDFLYPAHRLGLLHRLLWVAPPHVPRRYSTALVSRVQQMDGVSFDELVGFAPAGDQALRGSLLGLDITVCDHAALDALDPGDDYDLDIDIDYFVTVPGDTLWIDPAIVVRGIVEQLGPPRQATVSMAVSSGFTPLAHRFVGDYVCAVLSGDDEGIAHGQALFQAAKRLDSDPREAAALLRRQRQARPRCPHALYLCARLEDDPVDATALRRQAADIDPGYRDDASRDASAFPNRRRPLRREDLAGLREVLAREEDPDRRGLGQLALARLLVAAGQLDEAETLWHAQQGELAGHGDIALAIAHAHLAGQHPEAAEPWLQVAGEGEKTRTVATLCLGDLAAHAQRFDQALAHYREVSRRAPAWLLPLERQRHCHQRRGETTAATALATVIARRQQAIAAKTRSAS